MYLKDDFRDADGNIVIGKVIKSKKLIKLLEKLPEDIFLNCNDVSSNINVFDKNMMQLGYIDIGEDKFKPFEY